MRRLLVIGLLLLAVTGCSEPPQKELDQAQTAVDQARTAGADTFAAEEYAAAVAGLQKARAAVDQRDYRLALSYAIDSRQRAQDATRQTAAGKLKAQRAVEALLADVTARSRQLQAHLKTADAARAPERALRAPKAAMTEAQTGLQEARTAMGAGNYGKAGEILSAVRRNLDVAIHDAANIPPRAARPARAKPSSRSRRAAPPSR